MEDGESLQYLLCASDVLQAKGIQAKGIRYPQIAANDMTLEQQEAYERIKAETRAYGPDGAIGPYNTMLYAPVVLQAVLDMRSSELMKSPNLSPAMRHLIILLTARVRSAAFVWWAHVEEALKCGLERETVIAIAENRRPAFTTPGEVSLYDLVMELLVHDGAVSDETFAAARQSFGLATLVSVAALVGQYVAANMLISLSGLQPPAARSNRDPPPPLGDRQV
jgi:alkylhydroperoxidase family enzyme